MPALESANCYHSFGHSARCFAISASLRAGVNLSFGRIVRTYSQLSQLSQLLLQRRQGGRTHCRRSALHHANARDFRVQE